MPNPWLKKKVQAVSARGRDAGSKAARAADAQTALVVGEIFRSWLNGALPVGAKGGRAKA